jgi:hypothetical protein
MGQVANGIRVLMLAVVRYFVPVFHKHFPPAANLAYNNVVSCMRSGSLVK